LHHRIGGEKLLNTIAYTRIAVQRQLPIAEQQLAAAVMDQDVASVRELIAKDSAARQTGTGSLTPEAVGGAIEAIFEVRNIKEDSKAALLHELTSFRGFNRQHIPAFVFNLALIDAKQVIQSLVDAGTAPHIIDKNIATQGACDFVQQLQVERREQYAAYREEKILKHGVKDEEPIAPFFYLKRNAKVNLNGRIKAINEDNEDIAYVCRHFDIVMRGQDQDGPQSHQAFKERLDIFSDEESAGKKLTSIGYETLEKLTRTHAPSVAGSDDSFGQLLYELSGALNEGDSVGYMLRFQAASTECHAMTLYLHKRNGRIGIGVHDPNVTANMKHAEYLGEDKEGMSKLSLRQFMGTRYDVPPVTFSIVGVSESFSKKYAGRLVGPILRHQVDSIWDALADGSADHICAISQTLDERGKSGYELLNLLNRRTVQENSAMPGLYMALSRGHAEAIQALGDLLARIPHKERAAKLPDVLAAKNHSKFPGLASALFHGHVAAVKAFGELLKLIPEKWRYIHLPNLLEARDADGVSGLEWGLMYQRKDAVLAFAEIVQANATYLSRDARTRLLRTIREAHGFRKWYTLCIRINKPYYRTLIRDRDFHQKFKAMKEVLKH